MEFIKSINIDAVVADPILMMGIFFVIVGPFFFFVSLWKFIRTKNTAHFVVPDESAHPDVPAVSDLPVNNEPAPSINMVPETSSVAVSGPSVQLPDPVSSPVPKIQTIPHVAADQTIVMPAGMADVQAQIDILVAQIKQLNKKSIDLEESIEQIARQLASKMEINELKEAPSNAQDFAQKLLKLAEHVIALEKEMAKLKAQGAKAPIMPL